MDDDFDFGFTLVNENDIDSLTSAVEDAEALSNRLDTLYSAVVPLLANLKLNPDKDYIFWPDRIKKVEAFEAKLKKIYEGQM